MGNSPSSLKAPTDQAANFNQPAEGEHPGLAVASVANNLVYFQAGSGSWLNEWRDVWKYREILWILAVRDLKVRYRQTVIGVAWAVIQPLAVMTVFWALFHLLGRKPSSGNAPYALALLSGLIPWQLFAGMVGQATGCLVTNQHLIGKVYFPRVILPLATAIPALVDFGISFSVLVGIMAVTGVAISWTVLFLPIFVLITVLLALAAGLWLSALNAMYRDVGFAVPFALQIGLIVSPVVYQTDALIPDRWRPVFALNPMVGVIEGVSLGPIRPGGPCPGALDPLLSRGRCDTGFGPRVFPPCWTVFDGLYLTAMSAVGICVNNLGKRYRLGTKARHSRLSEVLDSWMRKSLSAFGQGLRVGRHNRTRELQEFWALRNVSFEVLQGEVVGVIGRNGAGKSTLLKVLSRITEPTCGRFGLQGRVGSLLEVGTGFHPELTGRENIFLSGTLLGMKRGEIRQHFDNIVEFSELNEFLDTPVKRYSSGMYVRLGFSIAAHLRPEILFIDEVLAVGDARFQQKCLGKVGDFAAGGRTVLFVSHNLGALAQICNRSIVLDGGRMVFVGPTSSAIREYLNLHVPGALGRRANFERDPTKAICLLSVELTSLGKPNHQGLDVGDPMDVILQYEVNRPIQGSCVTFRIDREGYPIFASFDTDLSPERLEMRAPGVYRATVHLPRRLFKAGRYAISVGSGISKLGPIDSRETALAFEIEEIGQDLTNFSYSRQRNGALILPLAWDQALVAKSSEGPGSCA